MSGEQILGPIAASHWLVVWTKARAERLVAARVTQQGMESWVPTVTERHRWSDRWQNVVRPLFPGYVFVRPLSGHWAAVLRTPGVLTVVKTGTKPALLRDGFVASIREALAQGVEATAVTEHQSYQVSDEVIVKEGPLAGLRGVVHSLKGSAHLVIWIEQIGRGVGFSVPTSALAPAPCAKAG